MPGIFGKIGAAASGPLTTMGRGINRVMHGADGPLGPAAGFMRRHGGISAVHAAGGMDSMRRAADLKMGRRAAGIGAAALGMGVANRPSQRGGYNPRRPVMPTMQNGRPM